MAHHFESGFFVGEPAWHGLGKVIPKGKRLSIEEGLKAAGLDWEVGRLPLVVGSEGVPKELQGTEVQAYCTYRMSDNTILGHHVGDQYRPYQNLQAFEWFQPFLDKKQAELHTAGSLHHGKTVWVLAKLNLKPAEIVKDDPVESFILLSNSHDGTKAVKVGFTPIRVVCNNTLAMAHGSDASKLLRVKHTKNIEVVMAAVRETMDVWKQRFEASFRQYKFLASKGVSGKDLEKYVTIIMAELTPERYESPNLKISTRKANQIEGVLALAEAGMGTDNPQVLGTWWGAYNALTEYLDYQSSRNADNRMRELWYAKAAKTNQRALDLAFRMAS